jgi:ABC-type dipeptide/oligopeptide/nickel transport system permease component
MNGAAEEAVNGDLLATCAQVSIAAVIVVGIDAAAMHLAARAISGGKPAASIHDRVEALRQAVLRLMTPVVSMTSETAAGPFEDLDRRVKYNQPIITMINCALATGLVAAAAMPIIALVSAILGLWLKIRPLEGLAALTTILSVLLVAFLLFLQIKMRAKELAGSQLFAPPSRTSADGDSALGEQAEADQAA